MDDLVRAMKGEVLTSAPEMYARDYGNVVTVTPRAVALPESPEDVQALIAYARKSGMRVVSRGHACTGNGQALSDQIVLDTSKLTSFRAVSDGVVSAGAGWAWGSLQDHLVSMGLSTRVLTDYAQHTVGGTLAVGGYGQTSTLLNGQVDQVVALDVVTGTGELVHATPDGPNADLFNYTLCGLGQTGVIVSADVKVRQYRPFSLLNLKQVPGIGNIGDVNKLIQSADPPWETASVYYNWMTSSWEVLVGFEKEQRPERVDEGWTVVEHNYKERAKLPGMLADMYVDADMKAGVIADRSELCFLIGDWNVPGEKAPEFAEKLNTLFNDPRFSPGLIGLIFRNAREGARLPLAPMPDADLVNLLTPWCIVPRSMVDDYKRRFDEAIEACLGLGGRVYLYGYYPGSRDFYKRQFGEATFDAWVRAKDRYDPGKILGPQLF